MPILSNSNPKLDRHSLITPQLFKRQSARSQEAATEEEVLEGRAKLSIILDLALQSFQKGAAAGATVDRLAQRLHELRKEARPSVWRQLIPAAQQHGVMEYLLQDPFTRWSFEKPRGYSGDATLLDIYYKHPSTAPLVEAATPLGREIYAFTTEAASSVAGRERRDILAGLVDSTAQRVAGAEVLAVACGHLREAELSHQLAAGRLGRWVGMDQDPDSVASVNAQWAGSAVSAFEGSVRGLLRRSYDIGQFDLVYASGLYDYLPDAVGIRLLQRMMDLVKPGGQFLFANFSDEIATDGYMEMFMDWPLILRSENDMWNIINGVVDRNEVDAEVFYGSNRNVVYGTIRKRD
jgi:SAM-dependent methyltransferase